MEGTRMPRQIAAMAAVLLAGVLAAGCGKAVQSTSESGGGGAHDTAAPTTDAQTTYTTARLC